MYTLKPCRINPFITHRPRTVAVSGPPQYHPDYYPFAVTTCGGPFVIYQYLDPVFDLFTPKWSKELFGYFGYNGTIIANDVISGETIYSYVSGTYDEIIPSCP